MIRMLRWSVASAALDLVQGDITRPDRPDGAAPCAVVNAANAQLAGGGGVDGAIHRAAGTELLDACQKIIAERGKPLEPGEAVATPGFNMPAQHVIHTVGPVWKGGAAGEEKALRKAWASSLALARELDCKNVAFPAISCGVYGYPVEQAARAALETVQDELAAGGLDSVSVYLFDQQNFDLWTETAQDLFGQPAG